VTVEEGVDGRLVRFTPGGTYSKWGSATHHPDMVEVLEADRLVEIFVDADRNSRIGNAAGDRYIEAPGTRDEVVWARDYVERDGERRSGLLSRRERRQRLEEATSRYRRYKSILEPLLPRPEASSE